MKNNLMIIVLATCIFTLGCKKKTSTPVDTQTTTTTTTTTGTTGTAPSIIGTWNWTELYQLADGNTAPVASNSLTCPSGKQITFSSSTYNATWTYALMGTPPATNPDNGGYSNTDSLTLNSVVTPKTARGKVYKLTGNELWYRYRIYNGSIYEVRFTR